MFFCPPFWEVSTCRSSRGVGKAQNLSYSVVRNNVSPFRRVARTVLELMSTYNVFAFEYHKVYSQVLDMVLTLMMLDSSCNGAKACQLQVVENRQAQTLIVFVMSK